MPTRRVTLTEAANILGVSKEAVRKRIARGTLRSDMGDDGRRYVYLDVGKDADHNNVMVHDPRDVLIAQLREEVEAWREESRRKDHIILSLTQRIPEIEAPQEPLRGPETATEGTSDTTGRADAQEGSMRSRPWWRRMFGFGG